MLRNTTTRRLIALLCACAVIFALTPATIASAQPPTCGGKAATIVVDPFSFVAGPTTGTAGDDVIVGSPGNDWIESLGGNDIICGAGGDDSIDGGTGHDVIFAGAGDDTINGARGRDRIYGGSGNDLLQGSSGKDRLFGGPGNDVVTGGVGPDRVNGGPGTDTCDRDGTESPNGCSRVVSLSYQQVRVIVRDRQFTREENDVVIGDDANNLTITSHSAAPVLRRAVLASIHPTGRVGRVAAPVTNSVVAAEGGNEDLGFFAGSSRAFAAIPQRAFVDVSCCYIY